MRRIIFQQLLESVSLNPKRLFLIDGFGAIISAFVLGVVLVRLESVFGIPIPTLYFLAFLPAAFAVYDFFCYARLRENIGLYLKGIAYLNLSYCFISLVLLFYHHGIIRHIGWAYMLLEICIVSVLAGLELRTAKLISKNKVIMPCSNTRQ